MLIIKTAPFAASIALAFVHEKSADDYEDAGVVKTQPSSPGGRPQRSIKPGSFVVLVVGK